MKIALLGRNLDDIRPLLEAEQFIICKDNPDIIIAHGGDGTLLGVERDFPGVPKFPIRDKRTALRCSDHTYETQLTLLKEGKLRIDKLCKIFCATTNGNLVAMNDIFIHNKNRLSAVRYKVWIDGELYAEEIVGDGVGVATVHGSTAYYRSITHSIFRVGLGLAFNNSTEVTNHLVLPEESVVKIKITRGPAIVVADNCNRYLDVREGEEVIMKKIDDKATIHGLDIFMCPKCRRLRHRRNYEPELNENLSDGEGKS